MPPEPTTPPVTPPVTPPAVPPSQDPDMAALKAELETLRAEKKALADKDLSLGDKVRNQNDLKSKADADSKSLESALTFNLTSADFLKMNESLLPKEIGDIFKVAASENYDSAIHRANATKAEIIQSFFKVQANVDLLTDSQKNTLADYLKLTKNGKEERSREIYDNLFEPALGTMKRVKKAEELNRSQSGFAGSTDVEQAYKEKLVKMAEKKFFKGKN